MLSIARIFLVRPAFVFLDRPGSSLPPSQIVTILEMLTDQGIGVVIFSKKSEAQIRFDSILEIKSDGKWVVHAKYWPQPGTLVFSHDQIGGQIEGRGDAARQRADSGDT